MIPLLVCICSVLLLAYMHVHSESCRVCLWLSHGLKFPFAFPPVGDARPSVRSLLHPREEVVTLAKARKGSYAHGKAARYDAFSAFVALGSCAFAGVAASLVWKATEAECVVGRIVSPGVAWKATLGHARTQDTYHLYQCTTHPQRPAPDPRSPPRGQAL